MKLILIMLLLSGAALLADLEIASLGLLLVAVVLLLGDLVPPVPCDGNCNQGRECSCRPVSKK